MLPKKPKRKDYLEGLLTDGYYFKDLSNHYQAIAERAIEALKFIQENGKSADYYAGPDGGNWAAEYAENALREIQASEEE